MKQLSSFIYTLLALLLIIWLAPFISNSLSDKIALSIVEVAFCLLFILAAIRLSSALNVSQSQFNARYFGSMGLRLITALILIAIYLTTSQLINKFGTIFLIFSYFVYMGFEIRIILHKLRTNSEKSKNTDDAR